MGHVETSTADYGKGINDLAKIAKGMLEGETVPFLEEDIAEIKQHAKAHGSIAQNPKGLALHGEQLESFDNDRGHGHVDHGHMATHVGCTAIEPTRGESESPSAGSKQREKHGCTETHSSSEQDCGKVQGGRRR